MSSEPNSTPSQTKPSAALKLWYRQPARVWDEALPIGNGRLGAMLFGGVDTERIQLNEESLWGGSRVDNNNPGALENLPVIRDAILSGDIERAKLLADEHLLGSPYKCNSYQTLGDLSIHWERSGPSSAYRRELDLGSGIHKLSYESCGVKIISEAFASAPDDAIVVRLRCAKEKALNFRLRLSRVEHAEVQADSTGLSMTGQILDEEMEGHSPAGAHMRFAARLEIIFNDGKCSPSDSQLLVRNASQVVLLISAATDYKLDRLDCDPQLDPTATTMERIRSAANYDFHQLLARHIADHQTRMDRVSLDLEDPDSDTDIPTDERLQRFKEGKDDPHLIHLYFQLGRYLLLGSSRAPGVLPANLQGIWNEHIWAPWGSDYHVNINIQMNYWPANVCNLAETVAPLLQFMRMITGPGEVTARKMYGCRGWTMHQTTDVFGKTAVMDGVHWGMFPLGGAWMTFPLFEHFAFTGDEEFLKQQAYPIMRSSAVFILDFLVEDGKGRLVTVPSYSPENSYIHPANGKEYKIAFGPTMDTQIIRQLFWNILSVADVVDEDAAFLEQIEITLKRLPVERIGTDGTLMEWIEDYEEAEPGHRHISHLLALHPGSQISQDNPELFSAARKTIERRLAHGGGHTGWSRAWIINFYARLLDGERAYHHLRRLLERSTLPNLFDTHPPFQIDGNFGATASIAEMLLQSHLGRLQILPALPTKWPTGSVRGLIARGNFEVSIAWLNGRLESLSILSHSGKTLAIEYSSYRFERPTGPGETVELNGELQPQ